MAFTEDPSELIAAALRAYLVHADRDFDADLITDAAEQITIPEDPSAAMKLEKLEGVKVLIIPVGGSTEKITRGGKVNAVHNINVIIACPLNATNATRRKLNGLAYAMRSSLRGEVMASYWWQGDSQITKYDPDRLRESHLFLTAFTASYFGIEK
jgi:hypothetical protein